MERGIAFKTAAPRMAGSIARPRLLAALHGAGGRARWVSAPSGSGKSALGADHAVATGCATTWYRCDARDNDPAFFHAQFAGAFRRGHARTRLPPFCAEDHADPAAFAARFVAALDRACGSRAALVVVDDAQALESPAVLATLARALREGAASTEWLFLSQAPPPPALFDAVAARELVVCNDLPFAWDEDECVALARSLRLGDTDGERLRALTGGHAGALVLACELLRAPADDDVAERGRVDSIYDHLLARMLESLAPPRRALLEATALVPVITPAIAADLAGEAASVELGALAARGLLRRQQRLGQAAFEAHGLLRAGLERRVLADRAAAAAIVARTLQALVRHGALDDALALSSRHGSVPETFAIVEALAPVYARTGQSASLLKALAALPGEVVHAHGGLCFAAGRALLGIDEEAARGWFEHAHDAFACAGDRGGMRTASAAVMTAFVLEYGDIRAFDAWLARYREAGGDEPIGPGPHEAVHAAGALAVAVSTGAHAPGVDGEAIVTRVRALLGADGAWLNDDQKVEAARLLVDHACIIGTHEQAQALVAETRMHAESPRAGALQRGRWYLSAACAYFEAGAAAPAAALLAQAARLAASSGSRRLAFELGMTRIDAALKSHDVPGAAGQLDVIAAVLPSATAAQRAEYARLQARVLLSQRRFDEALRWSRDALASARASGYSGSHLRAFELEHAYALAGGGAPDEAVRALAGFSEGFAGAQRNAAVAIVDCLRFLAGGETDLVLLREGLAHAAAHGFIHLLARAGDCLARVCSRAFEAGIETAFCRRLVDAHRLVPPADAGSRWPWPVRVRTLGAFELEIDGKPYTPAHKSQDKPLELLKLLACCQASGRPTAAKDWIAGQLWPDAEAPQSRKSLDMAASRLRRVLGCDEALVAQEGRLGLSPRHVWTDVAALARVQARVGGHHDRLRSGREIARAAAHDDVAQLCEHYRGAFLPDDEERPWLLAGRDAVTTRVRAMLLAADALLEGDDDERLAQLLERLAAVDPVSEHIARALMRIRMRQGRPAEALAVFRRTRDMLSMVLSLPPARETIALRDAIYAKAQAGAAFDASNPPARS